METDEKNELYQRYKKLEDKLINKNIKVLILRGIIIFIWFIMFCVGTITIPTLKRTDWFSSKNYERENCVWDSTEIEYTTKGRIISVHYLSRIKDTFLSQNERKKRLITIYDEESIFGNNFFLKEYFKEQYPELNPEIDTTLYKKAIPLWINKNTYDARYISEKSPDKADFTSSRINFAIFLLSFPFYYVFIILFWKKWKKYKMKLKREVIQAKHQWQNYPEYD